MESVRTRYMGHGESHFIHGMPNSILGLHNLDWNVCIYFSCDMTIARALRWGVASVGVYSIGHSHPIVGPPFRYRECAGRRRSLEAAIVKKAGLWLWFLLL